MRTISTKNVWNVLHDKQDTAMCVHRILGELGYNYVTEQRMKKLTVVMKNLMERKYKGIVAIRKDRCRTTNRNHTHYKSVRGSGQYIINTNNKKQVQVEDKKENKTIVLIKKTEKKNEVKLITGYYEILDKLKKEFIKTKRPFCAHDAILTIFGTNDIRYPSKEYMNIHNVIYAGRQKKILSLFSDTGTCNYSKKIHRLYRFTDKPVSKTTIKPKINKVNKQLPNRSVSKMTSKESAIKESIEILSSNMKEETKISLVIKILSEK